MCYTIQQLEERIRKQGLRNQNSPEEIKKALELFRRQIQGEPLFVISGFDHPMIPLICKNGDQFVVEKMSWGLIPAWVKDLTKAVEMRNMTLNARGETIFDKPSFRQAAQQRALLPVTGFFEYHHARGKNFPYFIDWSDEGVHMLGCIWEEWYDPAQQKDIKTFSIVTVKGNPLMAGIHNNPQLDEPRMPLVLEGDDMLTWLDPMSEREEIKALMKPCSDEDMKAHTVRPLRGKNSPGNSELAMAPYDYPELYEPPTLF